MYRAKSVSSWFLAFLMVLFVFPEALMAQEAEPPAEAEDIVLSDPVMELAQQRQRPRGKRPQQRPRTRRPKPQQRPRSKQRPRRRRRQNSRCPSTVNTPVQVGLGPSAHFITGPIQQDQIAHFGGGLALTGVMLEETMRKHWRCFPAQYRKLLRRPQEVRAKPIVANLIPSELIISPKLKNTGIYGVGWNLIGFGLAPISGPVRFDIKLSLPLKYMYIHSDTLLDGPMHFLRPGLEGKAELEFMVTRDVLFSLGWASQLFIPQPVGGRIGELGGFQDSIWHIGQAFLKLHFRVPYESPMPR